MKKSKTETIQLFKIKNIFLNLKKIIKQLNIWFRVNVAVRFSIGITISICIISSTYKY